MLFWHKHTMGILSLPNSFGSNTRSKPASMTGTTPWAVKPGTQCVERLTSDIVVVKRKVPLSTTVKTSCFNEWQLQLQWVKASSFNEWRLQLQWVKTAASMAGKVKMRRNYTRISVHENIYYYITRLDQLVNNARIGVLELYIIKHSPYYSDTYLNMQILEI